MKVIRVFRLAGLALLALPLGAAAAPPVRPAADLPPRTISVPGEGDAAAAPDQVTFTVGITREGTDAKNAKLDLAAALRSVTAALRQRGLPDADVVTAPVSLAPNDRFDGGKRSLAGMRAASSVTVTVRALDAYEGALAAALQAGADEFRGATFGFSRQEDLEARARANAVADARRRADALAKAAGATVGRILSLAESGSERPPLALNAPGRPVGGMRGEMPPAGPAGGAITVRISIQAVWSLE